MVRQQIFPAIRSSWRLQKSVPIAAATAVAYGVLKSSFWVFRETRKIDPNSPDIIRNPREMILFGKEHCQAYWSPKH